MCDYGLMNVRSRPAKVGDRLVTRNFGTGTRGFASVDNLDTAVCVLSGTELAFGREVNYDSFTRNAEARFARLQTLIGIPLLKTQKMAVFRQINRDQTHTHHDAVEFPDGEIVLLTCLHEEQEATVLQLPAEPRTAEEAKQQERAAVIG